MVYDNRDVACPLDAARSMSMYHIRNLMGAALKSIALALCVSLSTAMATTSAQAQQPVLLDATYRHALRSKINGVDYQLTVVLPEGYEANPTARYPVFYVMDGNRWAQVLAVLLPRFVKNAGYPPFIVVGVDYPGRTGRYQDYGPVSQRYFPVPDNRGNANFMRVLKEEVFPLVDAAYRTDPADRGIGGHSMGGLFAAYALLNESETFGRYWISSPSLFYDDESLFKDFEKFRFKVIAKPLHVFTDIGGEELPSMQNVLARFGQRVVAAQPNKVMLRSFTVADAGHATVVPSVLAPAFEHLYMYRPSIIPSPANLVRFAGRYKTSDGTVLIFVTDGDRLMYRGMEVDYEQGSLSRLHAAASNRFYQRESSKEFVFPEGNEIPSHVRIEDARARTMEEAVRMPDIDPETRYQVKLGKP